MNRPPSTAPHSGPDLNRDTTLAYISSLIALAVLSILLVTVLSRLPKRLQAKLQSSTLYLQFKARILYAPLFGHRRSRDISFANGRLILGSPPSRLQAISLVILLAANILVVCYKQSPADEDTSLIAQYKLRLGAIAACNFIPIVLTSSIHNPLLFLLGIHYDSFNTLHRWLARITTLEVLAHLLCHVVQITHDYGSEALRQSFKVPFISYGLIAAALIFCIAVQSIRPLRSFAYELFQYCHIILVIVVFAFTWLHVKARIQKWYVLTAAVLWAVLRLWGSFVTAYRSLGSRSATASLEYLPGDAVRVTLHASRSWKFLPGQHIYLSTPGLKSFAAHPFSVIWADSSRSIRSPLDLTPTNVKSEQYTLSSPTSSDESQESIGHQSLYCIVKGRNGYTKKLLEHAKESSATGMQDTCFGAFVSGPYRGHQSLAKYSTVLLFAGGVGITHQLPYVKTLFESQSAGHTVSAKVHLVWAVPGVAVLKWIRPWLSEIEDIQQQSRGQLKLDLYVTRPFNSESTPSTRPFELFEGRPSVKSIIEQVVSHRAEGRVCISTCASGSFSDDVRHAARKMLKQGVNLDILEETYGW